MPAPLPGPQHRAPGPQPIVLLLDGAAAAELDAVTVKRDALRPLDGVSFALSADEIVAVTGPSGAVSRHSSASSWVSRFPARGACGYAAGW